MKPKVSVIIPCYNVELYLRECLDSVVNQTLKEIEIICIDDGSTDSTLAVLEEYASRDGRIKILCQKKEGQGVGRNKGIEQAIGEYLLFLDSDDWLDLDAIAILYNKIVDEKVDVLQFNYRNHNEIKGTIEEIDFSKHINKKYNLNLRNNPFFDWKLLKKDCLFDLDVHVWNRIYSLPFVKQHNIKFAPTTNGEDHLFWIGALLNAGKIYYLPEYLYNYRTRANSSVTTKNKTNMCVFENIKYVEDYIKKIGLIEQLALELENYNIQVLAWHYFQLPKEDLKFYMNKCQSILTKKQYKSLINTISGYTNFFQRLFSIKNRGDSKVITILGLKFKIKRGKYELQKKS